MSNKTSKFAWLAAISVTAGAAFLVLRGNDDESTPAKTPPISANADTKTPFNFGATPSAEAPQNTVLSATASSQTTAASNTEIGSDRKLSLYFFEQFKNARTASEKMDNLRWAVGDDEKNLNPDALKRKAEDLGLTPAQLIKTLQDTSREYFRQNTAPSASTNYGMMTYWNNLRLAYRYTGLDETGNYQEGLAKAYTSFDYATIQTNRNQYVGAAVQEILPQTITRLDQITTAQEKLSGRKGSSTVSVLENYSLGELQDLRNKIYLLRYAEQNTKLEIPANTDLYFFENVLDRIISDKFDNAAQNQKAPAPAPHP